MEKILREEKNVWKELDETQTKEVFEFAEDYKDFLNNSKTERECTEEIIRRAKEKGYKSIKEVLESGSINSGDKIYANNKGKGVALFVIGKEKIEQGMKIVGSHMDAPRLDLKPNPLYEDGNLAMFKTHYYGGVKKYQWVALPLALHGVAFNKAGEKVNLVIGEDENDPVLYITDLLPHLAKDQMQKKLEEGIVGEDLNVIIGSIPFKGEEKEAIKYNAMRLLNEKYGIVEEDFHVSEIEIVPSGKARDVGLDRSLVASHGHDDRVCAYSSLRAIFDIENPTFTTVAIFVDKEEVGSMGNTGMQSLFFESQVAELMNLQNSQSLVAHMRAMGRSKVLSGDVTAGFDPNFPEVLDKRNAAMIGGGVVLSKYTGSRGKGGSNDANAEFLAEVRKSFEKENVIWQVGELGKVDQGGGGTIAYILANRGAEVVDCGTPMLSMHAPIELLSKVDLYMTYRAYRAFYNN